MRAPLEHGSIATRAGLAGLRDMVREDIEKVVDYWHRTADLDYLGIDVAGMGAPDLTRQRYEAMLPDGDPGQLRKAFAITLGGETIGHTLLYQYAPDTNYSHWHIYDKASRAAGVSTALYPFRIRMYFDASNINRLIHQTRTRNTGVNRMLDRYVPVAETHYVDKPDGLALPGEFHMRHVYRADVPKFFARAAELGVGS
jgi:hypothetical protein